MQADSSEMNGRSAAQGTPPAGVDGRPGRRWSGGAISYTSVAQGLLYLGVNQYTRPAL